MPTLWSQPVLSAEFTGVGVTRLLEAVRQVSPAIRCLSHESPRRGLESLTRKVTDGVVRIVLGMADHLTLGNLDARCD